LSSWLLLYSVMLLSSTEFMSKGRWLDDYEGEFVGKWVWYIFRYVLTFTCRYLGNPWRPHSGQPVSTLDRDHVQK